MSVALLSSITNPSHTAVQTPGRKALYAAMTVISSSSETETRFKSRSKMRRGQPLPVLALLCFCSSISSGYLSYPAIATQYSSLDAYPMHNLSPVHDLEAIPQQR